MDHLSEQTADIVETQGLPVKAIYRDQFETALQLALDEIKKGTKKKLIVEILNEQGLKTKTGRKWTYSILRRELKKANHNQADDTPNPQSPL